MNSLKVLLLFQPLIIIYGLPWAIYYPHQFQKNDLCKTLTCSDNEICVIRENSARCINKKLSESDAKYIELNNEKIHHQNQNNEHGEENKETNEMRFFLSKEKKSNKKIEETCDAGELKNIGGRLLQWFSEMRRTIPSFLDLPLHENKVQCAMDVAWMFQQWDGNNDGELSVKEIAPLETDVNEKCIKAFIDRCDTDPGNDGIITLDEWCDCFAWIHDSRHEPPCHIAKHRDDPHVPGVFHPQCTLEGYYKSEQCHNNWCWCVDKYGREFDNSRVHDQLPDCGQYATDISSDEATLIAEL